MGRNRQLVSLLALLAVQFTWAQRVPLSSAEERITPLHALPRAGVEAPLRSGTLHEWFIYQYAAQSIPIVDDFSIDRTQHLGATSTDTDVSLTTTVYHLVEGTSHAPTLKYSSDTTYHYVMDTLHVDTLVFDTILSKVPNPSIAITVFDITTYPSTGVATTVWPPYDVYDTIFSTNVDTLFNLSPDLTQDSLLVYTVSANTGVYTNPNLSTSPLILWQEDEAYVNGTFGDDPPTIGVCTFDGMDRTGYPYDPVSPNNNGIADHLTSVPISLAYPASDSVYLSFFIQSRGRSGDDQIQPGDSLRLEFYAPDEDVWYEMRSYEYTDVQPFRQQMVKIIDQRFLNNAFQMRFVNKATLAGSVDQWNIDYVRLGRNRSYTDTLLQDVAWVYPANSFLSPYSSVPFAKFAGDPAHYMAGGIDLLQKNLYNIDAFVTWGYDVSTTCGQVTSRNNYGNSIANNADTTFNTTHPVNSGANPFVYDVSGCTNDAFATVKMWTHASPDVNQYNDSNNFVQELSNYYSYDDGSAEWGYWLNSNGAQLAYRFDTQGDDSLRAVRMYFDPIFTPDDPTDGNFLITVWSDLGHAPIFQNVSFSKPEYRRWGPDHFVEYALDSTIHVSGTFYVGWVQTSSIKMNLGLDVDRVNNDRMFYNVSGDWVQSQIQGSWMIRPVMVSATDPFAGIEEPLAPANALEIHPNPANDALWLHMRDGSTPERIELLDAMGRVVMNTSFIADAPLSLSTLSPGLYIVRALDQHRTAVAQERVIVQR